MNWHDSQLFSNLVMYMEIYEGSLSRALASSLQLVQVMDEAFSEWTWGAKFWIYPSMRDIWEVWQSEILSDNNLNWLQFHRKLSFDLRQLRILYIGHMDYFCDMFIVLFAICLPCMIQRNIRTKYLFYSTIPLTASDSFLPHFLC